MHRLACAECALPTLIIIPRALPMLSTARYELSVRTPQRVAFGHEQLLHLDEQFALREPPAPVRIPCSGHLVRHQPRFDQQPLRLAPQLIDAPLSTNEIVDDKVRFKRQSAP